MSQHHRVPYVRPLELGANNESFHVRAVTDGTRTVAEVYTGEVQDWGDWMSPVGVGNAARRKGEKRDTQLGIKLATARALREASNLLFEEVEANLR